MEKNIYIFSRTWSFRSTYDFSRGSKTDLSHVATSHLIRLIIIVTVFPFFVNSYYDANIVTDVQETLKIKVSYIF